LWRSALAVLAVTGAAGYLAVASQGAKPPPIADFTASPTSGSSPLTVQFTDLSTQAPKAWLWAFGDGTQSTKRNPVHTYSAPGSYTVSLTASNGSGSNTKTKPDYIVVRPPDTTAPTVSISSPAANSTVSGTISVTASASDDVGVAGVQFKLDGANLGSEDTSAPYSVSWDTTTASPGSHSLSAVARDAAGNQGTASAVSVTVSNPSAQYSVASIPVLLYHQISTTDGFYATPPANLSAQLSYLKQQGYSAITVDQYVQWLRVTGTAPVPKPVLITFDDGFTSHLTAADSILAQNGFRAVDFIVTGWADASDRYYLSWSDIRQLQATGRWEMAFHAGQYGHVQLAQTCKYFYTCELSGESFDAYQTRVTGEVDAGIGRMNAEASGWNTLSWAAPFNEAGQFTSSSETNDTRIPPWVCNFFAGRFSVVFLEDDNTGCNRRYRYEVNSGTTLSQFSGALSKAAFARTWGAAASASSTSLGWPLRPLE
jgi:hypothetical protein